MPALALQYLLMGRCLARSRCQRRCRCRCWYRCQDTKPLDRDCPCIGSPCKRQATCHATNKTKNVKKKSHNIFLFFSSYLYKLVWFVVVFLFSWISLQNCFFFFFRFFFSSISISIFTSFFFFVVLLFDLHWLEPHNSNGSNVDLFLIWAASASFVDFRKFQFDFRRRFGCVIVQNVNKTRRAQYEKPFDSNRVFHFSLHWECFLYGVY